MSPFGPELYDTVLLTSDINLRHFPILSGLRTFHSCSFCLILLYCHNFKYEMHLEIPKFGVTPIVIRYRVTRVSVFLTLHLLEIDNI